MPTPEPKRCLGCGYILENLPAPRCPECGRKFDPANSSTYCMELKSGRKYLLAAMIGLLLVALPALGLVAGQSLPGVFGGGDMLMACAFVPLAPLGCMTEIVVLLVSVDALTDPSHCLRHRWGALAALILSSGFIVSALCLLAYVVFFGL